MKDTLKFPVGKIPEMPPENLPPEVIEAWTKESHLDLHRCGLAGGRGEGSRRDLKAFADFKASVEV